MKNGAIAALAAVPLRRVRREVESFLVDIRASLVVRGAPVGERWPNQEGGIREVRA